MNLDSLYMQEDINHKIQNEKTTPYKKKLEDLFFNKGVLLNFSEEGKILPLVLKRKNWDRLNRIGFINNDIHLNIINDNYKILYARGNSDYINLDRLAVKVELKINFTPYDTQILGTNKHQIKEIQNKLIIVTKVKDERLDTIRFGFFDEMSFVREFDETHGIFNLDKFTIIYQDDKVDPSVKQMIIGKLLMRNIYFKED